jgi:hypothetical protein
MGFNSGLKGLTFSYRILSYILRATRPSHITPIDCIILIASGEEQIVKLLTVFFSPVLSRSYFTWYSRTRSIYFAGRETKFETRTKEQLE